MRTSEERVEELHRRMDGLRRQKNLRRYRLQCALACAACLVLTTALAFAIAGTAVQAPEVVSAGVSASIFAGHTTLGYVVIALLAFCLGAVFTIFCFRLRKHGEEKDDDRKH